MSVNNVSFSQFLWRDIQERTGIFVKVALLASAVIGFGVLALINPSGCHLDVLGTSQELKDAGIAFIALGVAPVALLILGLRAQGEEFWKERIKLYNELQIIREECKKYDPIYEEKVVRYYASLWKIERDRWTWKEETPHVECHPPGYPQPIPETKVYFVDEIARIVQSEGGSGFSKSNEEGLRDSNGVRPELAAQSSLFQRKIDAVRRFVVLRSNGGSDEEIRQVLQEFVDLCDL